MTTHTSISCVSLLTFLSVGDVAREVCPYLTRVTMQLMTRMTVPRTSRRHSSSSSFSFLCCPSHSSVFHLLQTRHVPYHTHAVDASSSPPPMPIFSSQLSTMSQACQSKPTSPLFTHTHTHNHPCSISFTAAFSSPTAFSGLCLN